MPASRGLVTTCRACDAVYAPNKLCERNVLIRSRQCLTSHIGRLGCLNGFVYQSTVTDRTNELDVPTKPAAFLVRFSRAGQTIGMAVDRRNEFPLRSIELDCHDHVQPRLGFLELSRCQANDALLVLTINDGDSIEVRRGLNDVSVLENITTILIASALSQDVGILVRLDDATTLIAIFPLNEQLFIAARNELQRRRTASRPHNLVADSVDDVTNFGTFDLLECVLLVSFVDLWTPLLQDLQKRNSKILL
ncbi:hypothetical protein [Caudoviricetes sp.]|nr:hypothetical protein [Caudoviricetes sp.]